MHLRHFNKIPPKTNPPIPQITSGPQRKTARIKRTVHKRNDRSQHKQNKIHANEKHTTEERTSIEFKYRLSEQCYEKTLAQRQAHFRSKCIKKI